LKYCFLNKLHERCKRSGRTLLFNCILSNLVRDSCGLGYSVMIDSKGDTYQCHIIKETDNKNCGNILQKKLVNVVQSPEFRSLQSINVNLISRCCNCYLQYLCGGICRIRENPDLPGFCQRKHVSNLLLAWGFRIFDRK
jgi:radical SAM protein with 4Fe4S-binding SPASM domain